MLDRAEPGDFVYFDPPYAPLSTTSSFAAYTCEGFELDNQERLRDVALVLKQRGVHVVLSNSSAPEIHDLYANGFVTDAVQATRRINSKGAGRGAVVESLIW